MLAFGLCFVSTNAPFGDSAAVGWDGSVMHRSSTASPHQSRKTAGNAHSANDRMVSGSDADDKDNGSARSDGFD